MTAHHPRHSCDDRRHLRERGVLEMLGIWHRNFGAADALHRQVEFVERPFYDARADLCRDAAAAPSFVDNHRAMRAHDRIENRLGVERPQRAKIHDLRIDPRRSKLLSSLKRLAQGAAVCDQTHVRARASYRSLRDLDRACIGGHLALHVVQRAVLEDEHRVGILERCP